MKQHTSHYIIICTTISAIYSLIMPIICFEYWNFFSCCCVCIFLLLDPIPRPETDVCPGDTVWKLVHHPQLNTTYSLHYIWWVALNSHATFNLIKSLYPQNVSFISEFRIKPKKAFSSSKLFCFSILNLNVFVLCRIWHPDWLLHQQNKWCVLEKRDVWDLN